MEMEFVHLINVVERTPVEEVLNFLQQYSELVQHVRNDGWTLLHCVIKNRRSFCLPYSKFDQQRVENKYQSDLLLIVQYLIEYGVNLNAKNENGDTALIFAVAHKEIAVVLTLLNAGADAAIQNNAGKNALSEAISDLYCPLVQLIQPLLKANALINIQDHDGNTVLHKAMQRLGGKLVPRVPTRERLAWKLVVERLIALGADQKIENLRGKTPQQCLEELVLQQSQQFRYTKQDLEEIQQFVGESNLVISIGHPFEDLRIDNGNSYF